VLSRFAPEEEEEIDVSAAEAVDALLFWLRSGDLERCMTRFHSRWNEGPRP
jgi:peptidyl-tRNA hydrolase